MSVLLLRRAASTIFKPSNFTSIRFVGTSRNNDNNNIGASLCGSLFVPSQYSITRLPLQHLAADEEETSQGDGGDMYKKYYGSWKQYISQSALTTKSGNHLSLSLSKILLRTIDEYMEGDCSTTSPNYIDDNPVHEIEEPSIDGPIAVLDSTRYFSLKKQDILSFERPLSKPNNSLPYISSSWRHWLIITCNEKHDEGVRYNPWAGTKRFCLFTGFISVLPKLNSITCHLSSPFVADIIENKSDRRLVLTRFAMTSPSAPPWGSIVMAIDTSRGYLVYTGGVELEHPDCWIVSDSTTNYATGDLLYLNREEKFYVLPDAKCGHLEVWSFHGRVLSKISEIHAELVTHNDNSYHHNHSYLVESLDGNLLLVKRYVNVMPAEEDSNDNLFKTHSFEVFKLNFESKHWEVMASLGNEEALFVGSNISFALPTSKYPEVIPNSIYFTDQICHHHHGGGESMRPHGMDNGIFHLQDGTFTALFASQKCGNQPPVWLCPPAEWWTQYGQNHYSWGLIREY